MGAIKDITDLVTQLLNSAKDRQFAAELLKIQGMIGRLQSEQAALHEQNMALRTENAELKQQITALKQAKPQDEPKQDDLGPETVKILKRVFDQSREFSSRQIASIFNMKPSVADFHVDVLAKRGFVEWNSVGFSGGFGEDTPPTFGITAEGREYIVKNGLA